MEWSEPGRGAGLWWLWLRCERCGGYVRRPGSLVPSRGARLADVDWDALRAGAARPPWPRRAVLLAVIAGQLGVLGVMLAWGVSHLPH